MLVCFTRKLTHSMDQTEARPGLRLFTHFTISGDRKVGESESFSKVLHLGKLVSVFSLT